MRGRTKIMQRYCASRFDDFINHRKFGESVGRRRRAEGDMPFLDKVARICAELLGPACDMPAAQVAAAALPLMGIVPEPSWALPQMVDAIMTAMTGSSSTSRAAPTAPATAPVTAPATAPAEPLSTAPAASKKAAGKLRRQAARPNLAAPRGRWRRRSSSERR